MRNLTPDQMAEMEMLREQGGGILEPAAIVNFARSSNTALHRAFTWDDTEAAEKFRLHQAKQVIRAAVTYLQSPSGPLVPVRVYASAPSRGGYVTTASVLANDESAEELLRRLRADVQRTVARYERYAALAPHIAAVLQATERTAG